MKTDAEWEARAKELLRRSDNFITRTTEQMALQLGREMAQEAADARAEEIAQKCERVHIVDVLPTGWAQGACLTCAAIARSTIRSEKGTSSMTATEVALKMAEERRLQTYTQDEAAIRADERERIADAISAEKFKHEQDEALDRGWRFGWACAIERASTIARKPNEPKTREQVLEEALRKAHCTCGPFGMPTMGSVHQEECPGEAARRALDYREPEARVAPRPSDAGEWKP